MSLLGRKTSLLEEASQVLKDFQAVSEVEPARDRAKSFSRQASFHAHDIFSLDMPASMLTISLNESGAYLSINSVAF